MQGCKIKGLSLSENSFAKATALFELTVCLLPLNIEARKIGGIL